MVVDRVEAYISHLEQKRFSRSALVRARLLLPAAGQREWFSERGGEGLEPGDRFAMVKRIEEGKGVSVEVDLSHTSLMGQQSLSADLRSRYYVEGYNTTGRRYLPRTAVHEGGASLVTNVVPSPGDKLSIKLQLEVRTLAGLSERRVASGRSLQIPAVERIRQTCRLLIRSGGAHLVALSGGRFLLVEAWTGRGGRRRQ